MSQKRLALLLSAVLGGGLVIGAAWPPPPLPKLQETADDWSLPAVTAISRHAPQDMDAVARGLRWKGDEGGALDERSPWRLLGILNERTSAVLISSTSGQGDVSRINVGERLPDGSTLESVQGDKATTRLDRCITTYQLFIEQPIEQSDGCEIADTTATAQGSNP